MIATLRRSVTTYVARRSAAWRWALALLWAGFIWWLSSRPTGGGHPGMLVIVLFNSAHVFLFGVLAALVHLAGSAKEPGAMLRAMLAATAWGCLDEWHQSFVPGRQSSFWDVGTDVAGALLFTSVVAYLRGDRASWHRFTLPLAAATAMVTVGVASFG